MQCPTCRSIISDNAIKCRFCNNWITNEATSVSPDEPVYYEPPQRPSPPTPQQPSNLPEQDQNQSNFSWHNDNIQRPHYQSDKVIYEQPMYGHPPPPPQKNRPDVTIYGPPEAFHPPNPQPASIIYGPPPSYQQNQNTNFQVVIQKQESIVFAIITLILYLFSPLGGVSYFIAFILTIIGMFTGPKKGCFTQMFVVFFIIPVAIILVLIVAAKDILDNILDGLPF